MTPILRSVPYFSGLSAADLLDVERSAIRNTFQADQIVLMEGDSAAGLYIVEKGWLKVIKLSSTGREQVLNFIGASQVFNGVAVFTDSINQATVIALEESVVWCINKNTMQELLITHPRLAQLVIQDLASRLQHLVGLVEDLSLRSVESRLARTLLEGAIDASFSRKKWATQTELASRLGTVPDVLNRALRKLVDEELIEVTRHQIRIINLEGLSAKVDN